MSGQPGNRMAIADDPRLTNTNHGSLVVPPTNGRCAGHRRRPRWCCRVGLVGLGAGALTYAHGHGAHAAAAAEPGKSRKSAPRQFELGKADGGHSPASAQQVQAHGDRPHCGEVALAGEANGVNRVSPLTVSHRYRDPVQRYLT